MSLLRKIVIRFEQFLASAFFRERRGIIVLCFHDICDDKYTDRYCIRLDDFKRIIDQIRDDIIAIDNILQYADSKETKYVITFDDGYVSLFNCVFDYLKDKNIPFCAYISTDFIDEVRYLSKEQIVKLSEYDYCTIGSHMCSHSKTRDLGYKRSYQEWKKSKAILENIIGKGIHDAALPYGSIPACSLGSIVMAYLVGYETVATTLPYRGCHKKLLTRLVYDNESLGYLKTDNI